jgi:hypothetical protein
MYYPLLENVLFIATCFSSIEQYTYDFSKIVIPITDPCFLDLINFLCYTLLPLRPGGYCIYHLILHSESQHSAHCVSVCAE